jgi:hypothetical protein
MTDLTESTTPALPVGLHRVTFSAAEPIQLPAWTGSAWRGAFGHALRRTVCVTRAARCEGCLLLRSCPYPFLFDTPAIAGSGAPNPYVLVPTTPGADPTVRPGDPVRLGVALIGARAMGMLAYVVHALERAGVHGLTARRSVLRLERVQGWTGREWVDLYEAGGRLAAPVPVQGHPPAPAGPVTIRLLTPLRVRDQGRLLSPERLDFHQFFRAVGRRILALARTHGAAVQEQAYPALVRAAARVPAPEARLRWRDWTRYSARQRAKMRIGGIVGTLELQGADLAPFWPWLWLGQWVHAGRSTTMGLGMYRIEAEGLPSPPQW